MKKNIYIIIVTTLIFFSCGKEDKNTIKKSTTVKKTEGNYVTKKWKKTKDFFVDSDSVVNIRKHNYYNNLFKSYPDFKVVQNWFLSKPKQLLNMNGDLYKMINSSINNNETISYTNLAIKGPQGTYKYLFVTNEAFYIYDLLVKNNSVTYKGLRRIKKGYRNEPMHDLIFDSSGNLKQEIYQGEVKQDLFTKNGHVYFEFEKSTQDGSVINTIDLGKERNF